jgi:glutamyl-Q tRNA(Asp) synthetase
VTFRTRFAPSPTGPLHLGHAYSAMLGFDMAMEEGGEWLLRIEDIDQQRSKPEWERQICEDLEWLGLWWPEPVMRQSERGEAYEAALQRLAWHGHLYRCDCSRADILAALDAPQEGAAPVLGPDGLVYPGTCKSKEKHGLFLPDPDPEGSRRALELIGRGIEDMPEVVEFYRRLDFGPPIDLSGALRLHMDRAAAGAAERRPGETAILSFSETGQGLSGEHERIEFTPEQLVRNVGDVVLARRGMRTSYHLSVVLDDAAQGITHVVRGQDLFEATKIHVVLQRLLGLPTPVYHHHGLVRDDTGRRLAKREDAKAIRRFREEGATPRDIRRMVGLDPVRGP